MGNKCEQASMNCSGCEAGVKGWNPGACSLEPLRETIQGFEDLNSLFNYTFLNCVTCLTSHNRLQQLWCRSKGWWVHVHVMTLAVLLKLNTLWLDSMEWWLVATFDGEHRLKSDLNICRRLMLLMVPNFLIYSCCNFLNLLPSIQNYVFNQLQKNRKAKYVYY